MSNQVIARGVACWDTGWSAMSGGGGLAVLLIATAAHAAVIHVDPAATGTTIDGDSWETAYRDLQSALTAASEGDQIWVANGTYKPTLEYFTNEPRSVTFVMDKPIRIYGGFEGLLPNGGEVNVAQRDPVANPTILSGDLGSSIRAWHVVRFEGDADQNTQLDGFIIEKGEADFNAVHGGAGIYIAARPVIVSNCVVRDCFTSWDGGGVLVDGVGTSSAAPTFVNLTIVDNEAQGNGGGIAISWGHMTTLVNCVIARNVAGNLGGGIWNGVMFLGAAGDLSVVNCSIVDNEADVGGGIATATTGSQKSAVRNSILWKNRRSASPAEAEPAQVINTASGGTLEVKHSCIQNLDALDTLLSMNIGDDPDFVDFNGGDYRIALDSPAADAGLNSALPPDFADLDRDGVVNPTTTRDRSLRPRIGRSALAPNSNPCANPRVDMGALESLDCDGDDEPDTAFADTNGDGIPDACQDCNGTGAVDPIEIAEGTQQDCNRNGIPDDCEIASGCAEDANSNGIPDLCECLIDLVFIVDTSGSMQNEAGAVCEFMAEVTMALARKGRLAREPLKLGIYDASPFSALGLCLDTVAEADNANSVADLYGTAVPIHDIQSPYSSDTIDHDEDWGGATAVVAEMHEWVGLNRYIVILSDEGAQDGGPLESTECDSDAPDGSDYLAVLNAVGICLDNGVIVFPVGTPGFDADANTCVAELLEQMADGTSGQWYGATSGKPLSAIAEAIVEDMIDTTLGCPDGERGCVADLNDDCVVDGVDMGLLLIQWGSSGSADLNGDGTVDAADIGLLLLAWGACEDCEPLIARGGGAPLDPSTAGFATLGELLAWISSGPWPAIVEWLEGLLELE